MTFVTTTGCPQAAESRGAMMRAVMSTELPGPKGAIMVMGRSGQAWAAGARAIRPRQASIKRRMGFPVSDAAFRARLAASPE